jgi:hypothetical protein
VKAHRRRQRGVGSGSATAVVTLAWQRIGGGDAASAVAARRRRGDRGGSALTGQCGGGSGGVSAAAEAALARQRSDGGDGSGSATAARRRRRGDGGAATAEAAVSAATSTDSFSGFLDPGGRFAITNESVHYHHRSGPHLLSDGYSCHGRVEQVKLNENFSKSVSVPSPPEQDEEVMEAGDILKTLASSYETQSCRRHPPAATTAVHGARAAPPHILEGSARPPVLKNGNN